MVRGRRTTAGYVRPLQIEDAALKLIVHKALSLGDPWAFHNAYAAPEESAVATVAVVLLTTDVALEVIGKTATWGPTTTHLLQRNRPTALILDEAQRCPKHGPTYSVFNANGRTSAN